MGTLNTSNFIAIITTILIVVLNTGFLIDVLYPEMTFVFQHYYSMDQLYYPYLQEH